MQLIARAAVTADGDAHFRFVRRMCEIGQAYVAAGADGLARVKSQRRPGAEVTLIWSEVMLAQSYAAASGGKLRIKQLRLADIIQDVLPAAERFGRLIGPDWGLNPVEAEIEPRLVSDRLRIEAVNVFVARAVRRGVVWILEGADGPGFVVSSSKPGSQVLPCWVEREDAERRLVGPFEEMQVAQIPLHNLVGFILPWLQDTYRLVAPEHFWGGGAIELDPEELRYRLFPDLQTA